MAKTEEIKFFDQHMEKVILGVCALIMAYGVLQWVLSAPERPEVPTINGRVVASKDLDQELLVWAKNTRDRKPSASSNRSVLGYDVEIARQRTPAAPDTIGSWGAPRIVLVPPKRFKPPEGIRLKNVTDILDKLSPQLVEVKGLRELVEQDDGVDKLVFRGKAEFPHGSLLKAWSKVFRGSAMDEVSAIALAVEIERRAVLGDGLFGPSTTVSRVVIPPQAGAVVREPVVVPDYDGKNADDVRKAIEAFSGADQTDVLRPNYWRVWSQTKKAYTTPWIKEAAPPKAAAPTATPAAAPKPVATAAEIATAADDATTELWFHDTDVVVQRRYSYRMRIVFFSPLYTQDDIVYKGTPKDASVKSIPSNWSPWVTAAAIPRTTQYFLTSAQVMGATRRLYCTIFTRSMGQVVAEKKFEATPGRIIGGVISKQIINPTTGEKVAKVVDFSTNATVVHLEFDKKFATKAGRTDSTRELICLEGGKLVSHILIKHMPADDPRSEAYKELQALAGQ